MTAEPNLAILSGEMSGDNAGAALARAIKALCPDVKLWGMGSGRMKEAGVELLYDSAQWSAIGVVEALKVYPELRFKIYPHILRELRARRPSAVVLIDFGAFNVTVARRCKAFGLKVLYYFPPGSWRKQGKAGAELARITDRIATPFPWSAERLAATGANVEFVGHPLLELVRPTLNKAQFTERYGMDSSKPIIGLLPGSRSFEIEHNTPAMIGAARLIADAMPEAQFVFGLASSQARARVERSLADYQQRVTSETAAKKEAGETGTDLGREAAERKAVTPEGVVVTPDVDKLRKDWLERARKSVPGAGLPPIVLAENMTYDVMAHSDALMVCSGTATLEAAILGTPMVILYRGSRLMELEAKVRRVNPTHIGMPNIIAGSRIVPEFIQHDASPEALAENTLKYIREPDTRANVKQALQHVRETLGVPGASERTARMTLELAGLAIDPKDKAS